MAWSMCNRHVVVIWFINGCSNIKKTYVRIGSKADKGEQPIYFRSHISLQVIYFSHTVAVPRLFNTTAHRSILKIGTGAMKCRKQFISGNREKHYQMC